MTKDIRYERETGDFAMYLDGQPVGYARTRREAEERLDALVYDRLTKGVQASADLTNALAVADATVRVEAASERGDEAALAVACSDVVDAIADGLPGGRAAHSRLRLGIRRDAAASGVPAPRHQGGTCDHVHLCCLWLPLPGRR